MSIIKKTTRLTFIFFVHIAGIFLGPASLYGQNNQDSYQQAYQLFDQGLYAQALLSFETLLSDDPENPALIYNIALCFQSLDKYPQADEYFSRLIDDPDYGDWAIYQLAILDLRQGFLGAAEIGLTQVVFSSSDADLVELATLRYQELLALLPTNNDGGKSLFGSVGMGYGVDNNIVDPRFLNASDEEDNFTELTGSLIKQWLDDQGRTNWQWQGFVFLSRYGDIADADLDLYNTSLEKFFYSGSWQLSMAIELERSESGGEDYLQRTAVNFSARSNYRQFNQGWIIRWQTINIHSLDASFDQLAGSTQEATIEYRQPLSESVYWRLGSSFSVDEREKFAGLLFESDLSADRQGVSTSLVLSRPDWRIEVGFDYRDSEYGDIVGVNGFRRFSRDDTRKRFLLRTDYALNDQWNLYAEASAVDNDSSIALFSYQQKTIAAGIDWNF